MTMNKRELDELENGLEDLQHAFDNPESFAEAKERFLADLLEMETEIKFRESEKSDLEKRNDKLSNENADLLIKNEALESKINVFKNRCVGLEKAISKLTETKQAQGAKIAAQKNLLKNFALGKIENSDDIVDLTNSDNGVGIYFTNFDENIYLPKSSLRLLAKKENIATIKFGDFFTFKYDSISFRTLDIKIFSEEDKYSAKYFHILIKASAENVYRFRDLIETDGTLEFEFDTNGNPVSYSEIFKYRKHYDF